MSEPTRGPRPVASARVQRPTWRDPRFLSGLALILLAAVLGALLVAVGRGTSPVLVAQRPLVPGAPITAGDVTTIEVGLGEAADHYLDGPQRLPAGAVALRDVRPGELVVASAVGTPDALDVDPVVVPVPAEAAEVLSPGQRVDVWVNARRRTPTGASEYGTPTRLLSAAAIARVPPPRDAGSGGPGRSVGVQLMVPRGQVAALVGAVDQDARVTLVPVLVAGPAPSAAPPTTAG